MSRWWETGQSLALQLKPLLSDKVVGSPGGVSPAKAVSFLL